MIRTGRERLALWNCKRHFRKVIRRIEREFAGMGVPASQTMIFTLEGQITLAGLKAELARMEAL